MAARRTPWRRLGRAAALAMLALAPVAQGATADDMRWLPGSLADYAPSGLPDFSQCRSEWSQPGQPGAPGQWTYAGPVALANVLWWLDSVAEPAPRPPPAVSDNYPLVTAYPVFGPGVDDHSAGNLFPLVEDLASRAGTDGRGQPAVVRGTSWESFVAATDAYLRSRRLATTYRLMATAAPVPAWLADRVAEGAGVVVVLGVWEAQEPGWRRVGGHYAALAGADGATVALADPLADVAALGAPGRAVPPSAGQHSCREAPRAHDDAGIVAHDVYPLDARSGLPDGRHVLAGYFRVGGEHEAAAFQGQNPVGALKPWAGSWSHGHVVMALDAALALVPASHPSPPPTATATPVATAPRAVTPTPAEPTASATRPGATATVVMADPSAAGAGRGIRRLWLPWARRSAAR